MKRIDAHQHFWKFDPVRDSWINDEMKIIQRDFFPEDLEPLLKENGFDGCIAVQADQSYDENRFLLHHTEVKDFIKGIVGWVDLMSPDVEKSLTYLNRFEKIKGFRHVLQGEKKRDLMLQPNFMKGISLLKKFDFTYDILIYQDQLKYIPQFVSSFPDQVFVIDHLAKPDIKNRNINEWKKELERLKSFENLFCKISGMVTEADWKNWKLEDFKPYIDAIVETFGIDRIMFGSDWPVCLVAASYKEVIHITKTYFSSFSKDEQEKFFSGNAARFYHL